MPVSIEELDATVRAFYEGRGEQVNPKLLIGHILASLDGRLTCPCRTAKTGSGCPEPGKLLSPPLPGLVLWLTVICNSSKRTPMPG